MVIGHITLCPFGRRQRQQPWGIGSSPSPRRGHVLPAAACTDGPATHRLRIPDPTRRVHDLPKGQAGAMRGPQSVFCIRDFSLKIRISPVVILGFLFYSINTNLVRDPFQDVDRLGLAISQFGPVFLGPLIPPLHIVIIEHHGLVFPRGRQLLTRPEPSPCYLAARPRPCSYCRTPCTGATLHPPIPGSAPTPPPPPPGPAMVC